MLWELSNKQLPQLTVGNAVVVQTQVASSAQSVVPRSPRLLAAGNVLAAVKIPESSVRNVEAESPFTAAISVAGSLLILQILLNSAPNAVTVLMKTI